MDITTTSLTRPIVARLCIEMDLLKKFPNHVGIRNGSKGFWQPVNYERVYNIVLSV